MNQVLGVTQLRSFVAIADRGGFGRAADALFISQPTVSQHVRQLEGVIGRALVRREGRRAVFTDAGDRLLAEARAILQQHDDALRRLGTLEDAAPVVVGASGALVDELSHGLRPALAEALPGRGLRFRIGRSAAIATELARGTVDVAVLVGFGGDVPGRPAGRLALDWFSAGDPDGDLDDEVPLVACSEPCGIRRRATELLHARGTHVRLAAEAANHEGVVAAARAGLGVGALPFSGVPRGLRPVAGLPSLGTIGVYVAGRPGIDERVLGAMHDEVGTLVAAGAVRAVALAP
ncbi:LysR family transcriptional regulator [Pseudoclavibacter chungangensis]|uniref:LysR family transcriptional regulator n=1 Tax=Pseudoclavibacter chungangensis TaxID=587635 RepID=A0A7J5BPH2_9MICO|nr:LysR family transcriptional regulator [Pseudoclavibacter chungangensis]KAB1654791.1 LysR family transcriptional regulator [Pseudoclavibacter chungangensis]NYJ68098.1 DNA-binding transcriptional LysR family regulator [Pseudoclavibacter chungangensis]